MQLQRGIFDFQTALMSCPGLSDESFKRSQERAREAFFDIMGLLRPWESADAKERQAKEIDVLRQAFREAFGGDMNDPAWKAEYEEELAAFMAARENVRTDADDMETLRQRYKEREERLKQAQAKKRRGRAWTVRF